MTSVSNVSQLTTDTMKCISFVSSSIEESNNLKKHGLHFGACRKLEDALSKIEVLLKKSPHSHKRADSNLRKASKDLLKILYQLGYEWDSNDFCQ